MWILIACNYRTGRETVMCAWGVQTHQKSAALGVVYVEALRQMVTRCPKGISTCLVGMSGDGEVDKCHLSRGIALGDTGKVRFQRITDIRKCIHAELSGARNTMSWRAGGGNLCASELQNLYKGLRDALCKDLVETYCPGGQLVAAPLQRVRPSRDVLKGGYGNLDDAEVKLVRNLVDPLLRATGVSRFEEEEDGASSSAVERARATGYLSGVLLGLPYSVKPPYEDRHLALLASVLRCDDAIAARGRTATVYQEVNKVVDFALKSVRFDLHLREVQAESAKELLIFVPLPERHVVKGEDGSEQVHPQPSTILTVLYSYIYI